MGSQFVLVHALFPHVWSVTAWTIHYLTARFVLQGVAITQENSLLDNTARIEGWLARFPMFDWVGGRTSEMSAVGLLPAALQVSAFPFFLHVDSTCFQVNTWGAVQGIDIKEMLVGAALMDEETRNTVVWYYKNMDNLQLNSMVIYQECV
jgi:glucose-6-phosphate isomerase